MNEDGNDRRVLEREDELGRFDRAFQQALAGQGTMLAVVGPAGIGKSSLLALARGLARKRGLQVLAASGSELERAFPYGVCRQLFEPALSSVQMSEREALLDGAASIGSRVLLTAPTSDAEGVGLPAVVDAIGGSGGEQIAADAVFAALHGLYWLAANLAERRPLLLAVDDAHWADAPSLRLLNYLAHRLDGLPIVTVFATRDVGAGTDGGLLDLLLDDFEVSVLRPSVLSETAIATLARESLASEPGAEFTAACRVATGGVPLYLAELLRALREAGTVPDAQSAGRVADVGPPAISHEVLGRVAHLERECAQLVRVVAVLGGRAELRDAAYLASLGESEASAAADSLVRAGIFARRVPLEFSHPIMRAAVYEDIPPLERANAHRRAAALLADCAYDLSAVSAHLLRTTPAGDRWTLERLSESADRALASGALQTAIECLRRALRESPGPSERFELGLALGAALTDVGDAEGVDLMRAAVESAPEPSDRARGAARLASALVFTGRPGEAVEILDQAISGLGDATSTRRIATQLEALLYVMGITDLQARRLLRGRLGSAIERVRRAPAEVAGVLLSPMAVEMCFAGAPADEVASLAERALRDSEVSKGSVSSPLPFVAAYALISGDRPEAAERALDDFVDRAARNGAAAAFTVACTARALARLRRGDLRGAESDADACIRLGAEERREIYLPVTLATLVVARLERGALQQARAVLDSPGAQASDTDGVLTQVLAGSRARVHFAEGDDDGGLRELERYREWATAWGEDGGSWPVQWRSAMALAELRRGNATRALELAQEDLELAGRFGAARSRGIALVAVGLCEGGDRGLRRLRSAVAALDGSADRLEHARALVELGAALRRSGERAVARGPLTAAMSAARRCGATVLAERAYEELWAAGARPHKILYAGVDALTPSEMRVARMAADGLTNREIAQSLFVTRKTVEVHLNHTYQKLDIASRTELSGKLEGGQTGSAENP